MSSTNTTTIYTTHPPPPDHMLTIARSPNPPPVPSSPSYGIDSLLGLLLSFLAFPLYLHATLRGKSATWDGILARLPPAAFVSAPVLDVGCGRGTVLLKLAQRKRAFASPSPPAYGIDVFRTADQTGNSPEATYRNAAALGVVPHTVLHTASFTERFPFVDGAFSLVTSSLAIHNAERAGRRRALEEMARVCKPGGTVILVDLYGYVGQHRVVLEELGWTDVDVSLLGWKMMFGVLPCQMLVATKPQ